MAHEKIAINSLDWDKVNGLVPAIIQDCSTLQVLMLGHMDQQALQKTLETGKITFYSRTKKRLWTKGETSGNYLSLVSMLLDCDNDTLLILARPNGLSCHLNNRSCFGDSDAPGIGILAKLEALIYQRYHGRPANSYVTKLFAEGLPHISQKVGEEGIEVALASVIGKKEDIKNEAADLLFHLLVLLRECQIDLIEVMGVLEQRNGQDDVKIKKCKNSEN